MDYTGPERRRALRITDQDIERIADRVAVILQTRLYAEVGRSVLRRAVVALGLIVLGFLAWLGATNRLP